MSTRPKFAFVSSALPIAPNTPQAARSGLGLILDRLLRCIPSERYCVITTLDRPPDALDAAYYFLKSHHMSLFSLEQTLSTTVGISRARFYRPCLRWFRSAYRAGKRLAYSTMVANAEQPIKNRGHQIAKIAQRENCALIVGCSGELYDLPAAHRASQLTGIPFVAYILDYYGGGWRGSQGALARRLEPALLKDAAAVLVTNEHMADIYRRDYGVEAAIIRNPCVIPPPLPADTPDPLLPSDTVNIVYTGAVYTAHYDAFHRLTAAIRALQRSDVKLHIFTNNPPSVLALEGISGSEVVLHNYLPPERIVHVQQRADILFLPLAFHSDLPKMIATSAPGKTGEYLAAGRAVLVHAPSDSFLSWYFRQHACGAVADSEDIGLLTDTLRRLIGDAAWREQLGQSARARAVADFDLAVVGPRFVNALETAAGVRFT